MNNTKSITRYLQKQISEDALQGNKIAFINGPRQVGKTTMAECLLNELEQSDHYYTWDDDEFRKIWLKNTKDFLSHHKLDSTIVFDEIHKDRKWKSKLKGLYDLFKKDLHFIVTGSARLDFYRRSGDSLQGRYLPYRMHPLSVGEVDYVKPPPTKDWDEHFSKSFDWQELLDFGGFPEPFFLKNKNKSQRWQRLYRERMIREDLRDLQEVRDIRQIESLALFLQEKASGQLSYESLREDLSTSFDSIKRWIDLLEALYFCYRLKPYSKNLKSSLKKEPKIFMYDWSLVKNDGARFENLVAGHLLKSCHAWTDCAMGEYDLFYVRDKQKREVDFLVTSEGNPYALIEVKSNQTQPTPSLIHFQKLLKPKFCIQIVKEKKLEKRRNLEHPNIQVMSAERFLGSLV